MIRVLKEEGHYTIKRVEKLPKKGNANWLYMIKSDQIDILYRWINSGKGYEEIIVGENLSGAQIKFLYEAESNTNAFTDSNKTKLSGIEDNAKDDQTGAEIKVLYEAESDTNALTDTLLTKLNGIEDNATVDQTGGEIKIAYESEADTNAFTDALLTKLNNIDNNATDDQTGSEIKTLYESEADTNAFTDAEKTLLASLSSGSLTKPFSQISSVYLITLSDYYIECTSNSFIVTLPTAVGIAGRSFEVKNTGSGVITLEGNASETIEGSLNLLISTGQNIKITSNGSNWIIT